VITDNQNEQFSAGAVYGLELTTGAELWRFDARTGFPATPSIAQGLLFVTGVNGDLYALDLQTGAELWRFKLGENGWESPAVADGMVYAGNLESTLYALDAATGVEVWERGTAMQSGTAPVVTDSTVYLPSIYGRIYAFDRATGAHDSERSIEAGSGNPGPIYSTPAISGGMIFVADASGVIRGYGDPRVNVPIEIGMDVEIVGEAPALLRAAPSSAAVVRAELQPGTQLLVIGSAEERDGQTWWPVEAADIGAGWISDSDIIAAELPVTASPTNTPRPMPTPNDATASAEAVQTEEGDLEAAVEEIEAASAAEGTATAAPDQEESAAQVCQEPGYPEPGHIVESIETTALRREPNATSELIQMLSAGTRLIVRADAWARVDLVGPNGCAWVSVVVVESEQEGFVPAADVRIADQDDLGQAGMPQATIAAQATEIAALEAAQSEAQATATALAEVASRSDLDPVRQTLTIQTDLGGMLGESRRRWRRRATP
jgi:hypothetical protein